MLSWKWIGNGPSTALVTLGSYELPKTRGPVTTCFSCGVTCELAAWGDPDTYAFCTECSAPPSCYTEIGEVD